MKDKKKERNRIAGTRERTVIRPSASMKDWLQDRHDTNIFIAQSLTVDPLSMDAGPADKESPLYSKVCLSWGSLKREREGK